ncbi:hypothetical protein CXB51_025646 [Gossypium anomalum]|uniref:BED-type domain-containing protein n=1 Tax=Gossypium anomalum TaxID=47600 RepID=A0A8J6CSM8_9ROSI|nr:hypothetical protein CXB51_025646 [Gossypium anomalum]
MASSNTPIPVDDGFNEYESALKCQKSTTSKVWDKMTNIECENKYELKAQYNHYKTIFSAKSSSGTSHLRRHLNSCLKKINKDITQYTIATQPSLGGVPSTKTTSLMLMSVVKLFLLFLTKKLRQDVCVRWNSTYLMLESSLYYKDVLDYWGQRDKDYQMFALSNQEWRNVAILCEFLKVFYDVTCIFSGSNYPTANLYFRGVWKVHKVFLIQLKYCFTTIYGIHASDFVETILSNLRLLFDEYVKKSKSTFFSLAGSSNVSDKNPVDSSLDEHNVNSADFGEDFDKSDYYKRMGKKVITPLRSSLKPKRFKPLFAWMIGCELRDFQQNNDDDEDDENDEDNEDDVSSIAFRFYCFLYFPFNGTLVPDMENFSSWDQCGDGDSTDIGSQLKDLSFSLLSPELALVTTYN